jgi:hypothetical protein
MNNGLKNQDLNSELKFKRIFESEDKSIWRATLSKYKYKIIIVHGTEVKVEFEINLNQKTALNKLSTEEKKQLVDMDEKAFQSKLLDKYNEYRKEYRKTDTDKEYRKEYHKRDTYKEYQKEYKKEYRKTDTCKEYHKEYYKKKKQKLLNNKLITSACKQPSYEEAMMQEYQTLQQYQYSDLNKGGQSSSFSFVQYLSSQDDFSQPVSSDNVHGNSLNPNSQQGSSTGQREEINIDSINVTGLSGKLDEINVEKLFFAHGNQEFSRRSG